MFGMEKKGDKPFQFDLEVDLEKDPKKAKSLMEEVAKRRAKLKELLRQGADTDDFDEYGVLLHAYAALEKVLTKATEKK